MRRLTPTAILPNPLIFTNRTQTLASLLAAALAACEAQMDPLSELGAICLTNTERLNTAATMRIFRPGTTRGSAARIKGWLVKLEKLDRATGVESRLRMLHDLEQARHYWCPHTYMT